MVDLARYDVVALGRRAVEVTASAAIAFVVWLLCLPVLGFIAMGLHAALFGAWPWPAKVMYIMVGAALGLI